MIQNLKSTAFFLILAALFAGNLQAQIFVPSGLNPGDEYQIIFVTADNSGQRQANDTDMAVYNNWINNQAAESDLTGAEFGAGGVQYSVLASTQDVDARDNIETSTAPIYLLDDTLVAIGTDSLWDGSLLNTIRIDQNGDFIFDDDTPVWTGSLANGVADPGSWLGSSFPTNGEVQYQDGRYINLGNDFPSGGNCQMYGISEVLTVPGGGPIVVLGESMDVGPGIINAGGLPELEDSDDASLVLFRNLASVDAVTQFVLTATSPTTTPTTFDFVLEGRVGSRPNVVQRVEFFNYITAAFETVDEQDAAQMPPDLSITVTPTGDLSRFVDPSTSEIQARVRYRSDSMRAQFSSRTDQAVWMIE